MFKAIITASVSVMLLCLATAASAKSSCEETADTNYLIAVAIDYADADMVHEDTTLACESDSETLNELIAIDGEVVFPVCQFRGDCIARQADTMLAPVLALLAR